DLHHGVDPGPACSFTLRVDQIDLSHRTPLVIRQGSLPPNSAHNSEHRYEDHEPSSLRLFAHPTPTCGTSSSARTRMVADVALGWNGPIGPSPVGRAPDRVPVQRRSGWSVKASRYGEPMPATNRLASETSPYLRQH